MDQEKFAVLSRIVEDACSGPQNMFSYTIWTHHITRVIENARRLAPIFSADEEISLLAALLHDYASVKDPAMYPDHHIHGPVEAEHLLRQYAYPEAVIERVKDAIANHRGSVPGVRTTPEAECLANADGLAHLEQAASLLHLAYVTHGLGIDEGALWVRQKLERTWRKLSPTVQALAQERYLAAMVLLDPPA